MIKELLRKTKTLLLLSSIASLVEAAPLSLVKEESIFKKPSFASCHGSTLTETSSGTLLCSYFAGTEEGANDTAIYLSTLRNSTWESPVKIADVKDAPCWNPVLFTTPANEIILFYKVGKNPQQWSGVLQRSYDEGKTWTAPESLPAGVIGPAKNRPLLLQDGTLLTGSSIESWRRWGCFIDITSDFGKTWTKSTPINVESELWGIIQPTLFFGKEGTIRLLARSHQIGSICSSESHDQGKSWSPAKPISLPNPNSAIDAINLKDGRILLVYNHSKTERFPLNVALSKDGGETWDMQMVLEDLPGEYSYPCVIQTKDGKAHISYTWNRTEIKHLVLGT
ncbi:MAG: exo-alpha-sialidase [Simkaniaceae bacterium]|nr:exo-alpha-sialidase [Simkaniaceae bacterium]